MDQWALLNQLFTVVIELDHGGNSRRVSTWFAIVLSWVVTKASIFLAPSNLSAQLVLEEAFQTHWPHPGDSSSGTQMRLSWPSAVKSSNLIMTTLPPYSSVSHGWPGLENITVKVLYSLMTSQPMTRRWISYSYYLRSSECWKTCRT